MQEAIISCEMIHINVRCKADWLEFSSYDKGFMEALFLTSVFNLKDRAYVTKGVGCQGEGVYGVKVRSPWKRLLF